LISDYFKEVELRIINAEIVADKKVNYDEMVFRYDNAPHHDNSTFPHHKHLAGSVLESEEKGIMNILNEVEHLICKRI
jgi:hypothetical protein